MKKIIVILATVAALFDVTPLFASDSGWYLYGAAGRASGSGTKAVFDRLMVSSGNSGFTSSMANPKIYNLGVGYQIDDRLSLEGSYISSSTETYEASGGNVAGSVSAPNSFNGLSLAGIGALHLGNKISLLGKVGIARMQHTGVPVGLGTGLGAVTYYSGIVIDLTYGIGAKYQFTDAASVRLMVDRYNVGSPFFSTPANVWTLGLAYVF